jgi:hypothetical protein
MLSNIQAGQIGLTGQNGQNCHDWSKRKLQSNQAHSKLPKLSTHNAHNVHNANKRKLELLHANTAKHACLERLHQAKRKHGTQHDILPKLPKYLVGGNNLNVLLGPYLNERVTRTIHDKYGPLQAISNALNVTDSATPLDVLGQYAQFGCIFPYGYFASCAVSLADIVGVTELDDYSPCRAYDLYTQYGLLADKPGKKRSIVEAAIVADYYDTTLIVKQNNTYGVPVVGTPHGQCVVANINPQFSSGLSVYTPPIKVDQQIEQVITKECQRLVDDNPDPALQQIFVKKSDQAFEVVSTDDSWKDVLSYLIWRDSQATNRPLTEFTVNHDVNFVADIESADVFATSSVINDNYGTQFTRFWNDVHHNCVRMTNYKFVQTSVMVMHLQQHCEQYQLDIKRNPDIVYYRDEDDAVGADGVAEHLCLKDWLFYPYLGRCVPSIADSPDIYLHDLRLATAYNVDIDLADTSKEYSNRNIFQSLQKFAWAFGIGIAWLSADIQQPVFINCWSTTMFLVYTHYGYESVCQAVWVLLSDQPNHSGSAGLLDDKSLKTHEKQDDNPGGSSGSSVTKGDRSVELGSDNDDNLNESSSNDNNTSDSSATSSTTDSKPHAMPTQELLNNDYAGLCEAIKQHIRDDSTASQSRFEHNDTKYNVYYEPNFVFDEYDEKCVRLANNVYVYNKHFIEPLQNHLDYAEIVRDAKGFIDTAQYFKPSDANETKTLARESYTIYYTPTYTYNDYNNVPEPVRLTANVYVYKSCFIVLNS